MVSDSEKYFLLSIFLFIIPINEDLLSLLASHVCIISESKKGTKEIADSENESYSESDSESTTSSKETPKGENVI